jgi:hypothetical protein
MILRRKDQRTTIRVELKYQHSLGISGKLQAAVSIKVCGLFCFHDKFLLAYFAR